MKRLLLLLSTVSAVSAADIEGLTSGLDALTVGYSSDVEYANHQDVHERFFKRKTKNTTARARIAEFEADPSKLSINLDGLSSRTRILIMRELIMAAKGVSRSIPLCVFMGQSLS